MTPLLTLAIWVPIASAILVLATGSDRNAGIARFLALAGALAGFAVTLPLWFGFEPQRQGLQFVEFLPWVPAFNINYHLGIDGISLLLILLNSFTTAAGFGALMVARPRVLQDFGLHCGIAVLICGVAVMVVKRPPSSIVRIKPRWTRVPLSLGRSDSTTTNSLQSNTR